MPFVAGQSGNPSGRPPSIETQLRKIGEAAVAIERATQTGHLVAALMGRSGLDLETMVRIDVLRNHLQHDVAALVRELDRVKASEAAHAGPGAVTPAKPSQDAGPERKSRGRRRRSRSAEKGEQAFIEQVQQAALWLDRLVGEESPQ